MKNKYYSLLIAMAFISACSDKENTKVQVQQEKEVFCLNETLKKDTKWEEIQHVDKVKHINLTGDIENNPDKVFAFNSLINGFAHRVLFSLGDYVKKGQVLVEINSPELNNLRTESTKLTSEITVAERELSAMESMYSDNLASERELISARSEVQKLKSERSSLQQNLKLFSYNSSKNLFEVKSPSDGYIIEKNINSGMQISEGTDLFTISGLNTIWIMANVYARDIQYVEQGMNVQIKIPAYPNEIFEGKISSLSRVFDSDQRVLKAKIEIPNVDLKLKPGMSVDVIVENKTNEKAFALPVNQVIFDNNQNYVLVYHSDCELELRPIQVDSRNNENYYVSDGIKQGEKVISQNQLLLYEKLKS